MKFFQILFKSHLKQPEKPAEAQNVENIENFGTLKGLEFAFKSGNKAFYKFKSDFDMPVERALAAKDIYTELECGVDRAYLESYFETIEDLLNKGKLMQVATLTSFAKSRMKHISNFMLLYKLASVVFLAEDENPYRYDFEQAEKKIEFWIANDDVESFFLREPLRAYILFLESSNINLKAYFKAQGEQISQALNYHLSLLSETAEKQPLRELLKRQLNLVSLLK
jgi:hypothetical protein